MSLARVLKSGIQKRDDITLMVSWPLEADCGCAHAHVCENGNGNVYAHEVGSGNENCSDCVNESWNGCVNESWNGCVDESWNGLFGDCQKWAGLPP